MTIRSCHDPAQNLHFLSQLTVVERVVDTTEMSAQVLGRLEVLCSDEERGEEETKCEADT